MNQSIKDYRRLRDEVDGISERVSEIHSDRMCCAKGCCHCCQNLSVWPVEFYSILDEIRAFEWKVPAFNEQAACGFLHEGLCAIYPFRPMICRTHGLPLVYWHDETDPPGWGVMFCEKNFTESDDIEFTPENVINMDEVNEKLARANVAFIEERKDLPFKIDTRLELKLLENDIIK